MSRRQHECLGCGDTLPSLWGAITHCDPNEPIDDLDDEGNIIRSID